MSLSFFLTTFRIVPLKWREAIGLRFELIGCKQLTPSPLVSVPPTSSTSPGRGPTSCMYWTPWVNTNTPDTTGDYETIMHLNSLVRSCNMTDMKAIECRAVGTRKSWDEAGDIDVKCDLGAQGLVCFNRVQGGGQCQDYEIRVFCDECPSKHAFIDWFFREKCLPDWSVFEINVVRIRDVTVLLTVSTRNHFRNSQYLSVQNDSHKSDFASRQPRNFRQI